MTCRCHNTAVFNWIISSHLNLSDAPTNHLRPPGQTTTTLPGAVELISPLGNLLNDSILGVLDVLIGISVRDAQVIAVARAGDEDGRGFGGGLDGAFGTELAGHGRGPPRIELAVYPEQALGILQIPALGVLVEHLGRLASFRPVRVLALLGEEELALPLPVLGVGEP